MKEPIKIFENVLWTLLDDVSKLYILSLLLENDFNGESKLTVEISDNTTTIIAKDNYGHEIELPINVLSIINN